MDRVPAITKEQMRDVDRLMVDVYHIELIQMMENAGRSLAVLGRESFLGGTADRKQVIVLSGTGGNGGGGLVAARHLSNWGAKVQVILSKAENNYIEVPGKQLDILRKMDVRIGSGAGEQWSLKPDLIIDALVGYSLSGKPYGDVAKLIDLANTKRESGVPILSLDIPSGMEATTGQVFRPCIKASATMTLALPKTGLMKKASKGIVGSLYVVDISVPPALYRQIDLEIPNIFRTREIINVY